MRLSKKHPYIETQNYKYLHKKARELVAIPCKVEVTATFVNPTQDREPSALGDLTLMEFIEDSKSVSWNSLCEALPLLASNF